MPKKKTSKSGSKSAFVRSLDPKTPAAKVVELAKKEGMSLTPGLVYNIRSAAKVAGTKVKGKPGPKPGKRTTASMGMTSAEAQLRDAIADLGLVKATEILESVKFSIRQR